MLLLDTEYCDLKDVATLTNCTMGNTNTKTITPDAPWRNVEFPDFLQAEKELRSMIAKHSKEQLNLVMIGHIGAGKSCFLNTVCSILEREIVNMSTTKSDNHPSIGTNRFLHFTGANVKVQFYDTAGFSPDNSDDNLGAQLEELKAVFDGCVPVNYKFNADEKLQGPSKKDRPNCVIFIISAEQLDSDTIVKNRLLSAKYEKLDDSVPYDVARIVVIPKIDRVCKLTELDITEIYKSKVVYNLVKKATNLIGVEENVVFPVVNFIKEDFPEPLKSVPILYAIKRAFTFASNRQKNYQQ